MAKLTTAQRKKLPNSSFAHIFKILNKKTGKMQLKRTFPYKGLPASDGETAAENDKIHQQKALQLAPRSNNAGNITSKQENMIKKKAYKKLMKNTSKKPKSKVMKKKTKKVSKKKY